MNAKLIRFLLIITVLVLLGKTSLALDGPPYNRSLIDIVLISPKFGASSVDTFDLTINSSMPSECKYSYNPLYNYTDINSPNNIFSTSPSGLVHTIDDFNLDVPEGEIESVYILCKSSENNYVNDGFPIKLNLSIDKTNPKLLSAYADPSFVIEKLSVSLVVKSDDLSVCRFDRGTPNEEEYSLFFDNSEESSFKKETTLALSSSSDPNIQDEKNYTFLVSCMNKVGLFLTNVSYIQFYVNLSVPNQITELSPSGYISNSKTNIVVKTNRDSTCKYGTGYPNYFSQKHTKNHFIQPDLTAEGKYDFPVRCDFDQGTASIIEDVLSFAVVKSVPGAVSITADQETCSNTTLNATFTLNNTALLKGFYYRIVDSAGIPAWNYTYSDKNTTKISLTSLKLLRNTRYLWEVFAVDVAGNNGTSQKSSGTTILPEEHDTCKGNTPPVINISAEMTERGISAYLKCVDSNGCASTEYAIKDSKTNTGCDCPSCPYNQYDNSEILMKENTTICYRLKDTKNLTAENKVMFKIISTSESDPKGCGSKKGQICDSQCKVLDPNCNLEQLDSDSDLITDIKEKECGLNSNNQSDALADNDKDGLSNKDECLTTLTDLNKKDTDGDTYSDGDEKNQGTNPLDKTSFPIDLTKDTDDDGITDIKEKDCGLNQNKNDATLDNDKDGLKNKEECLTYKTNANKADTDGDSVSDEKEVDAETNPNDSEEFPKSHGLNIIFIILGVLSVLGGLYLFNKSGSMNLKSSPGQNMYKAEPYREIRKRSSKPLVDFNNTRSEMRQTPQHQNDNLSHSYLRKQNVSFGEDNTDMNTLDSEINKKREELKLKKMSSVFDEFSENKQLKPQTDNINNMQEIIEKKREDNKKTFGRLDNLSEKDAFEELEFVSKKDSAKKAEKMSVEEQDKLEQLGRRRKQ